MRGEIGINTYIKGSALAQRAYHNMILNPWPVSVIRVHMHVQRWDMHIQVSDKQCEPPKEEKTKTKAHTAAK